MDITSIKLALIDEDKDQPRYQFNQEALEELANSIKEIGLLSPIKVRDMGNGRYKIIYGNRRYKASQLIGLEAIPCIITDTVDELEIYYEQIAENLTREDFSPIEEAEAFHKLMNDDRFRSSIKLLSSKLGKTETYIKNKLELLKFSSTVKRLIVGGTQIRKDCLTEDQVWPLKDLPMEYRDSLALTAARDELPVSDVKKIAKLFKDSSISESTKQKLLLKDGRGLIETWSVFEQNRKEKLARQKEQEAAKLAKEQAKQEAAESITELQQNITKDNLVPTAQVKDLSSHATASAGQAISLKGPVITLAEERISAATVMTTLITVDKARYMETLLKGQQEAAELLEQVLNGKVDSFDTSEQLANDMLIKLQELQNMWRDILRASQA